MLGLLGLLGAVFAGFMVDALSSRDEDIQQFDEETVPEGTGSLLDDPGAVNDPDAGLPTSDDLGGQKDRDVTLQGGGAHDILTGNEGDDQVIGAEGNDLLGGRGGRDLMDGGAGADWLRGGDGVDTLVGAAGADDMHGDDGDDLMSGGDGDDTLCGDPGADRLIAGKGNDSLAGGEGADTLLGGDGDDALQGGADNDWIAAGAGGDQLDGNDGNDTLCGGMDRRADFLNGGEGEDDLRLGPGDYANGGAGADDFVLEMITDGDSLAQITDFDRNEDALILLYDPAEHASPVVSIVSEEGSADATVLLDGVPVAQVLGGAGLTAAEVVLQVA